MALASDDPQVREAARAQFERWGVAAVPFLLDAVQSAEPRLRRPAAVTLAELLAQTTVNPREAHSELPAPAEAFEPTEAATTTDVPATDPPTKARPGGEPESQAVRETDAAHPSEVRVYYGTNRQLVEETPDLRLRLFGLPLVLLSAGAVLYGRLRRRKPEAPLRSRWATSFIVLLASGAAIWSVSAWNDALRRHYSEHVGATFGPRHNAEGKIQYGYCDQIILAAPDIDADVFREQIAPAMAQHSQRTTLYCSNTDWALAASNTFNDGWRAGDSSRGILIVPGADTVDASGIDTALLGHSYYGDCLPLLKDVQMLFESNLPPAERELDPVQLSGPSAD